MDELEQHNEELRNEVNQLKEQMARILEILQSLERRNTEEITPVNEGPPATSTCPPGFISQGTMAPLTLHPTKPVQQTNFQEAQFPPYGIPAGYAPPMAQEAQFSSYNNVPPAVSDSLITQQQSTQPPSMPSNIIESPQTFPILPKDTIPNLQVILQPQTINLSTQGNPPTPIGIANISFHPTIEEFQPDEDDHSKGKLQLLEDRLRAVEGNSYGIGDAVDLCLVPDLVIPPKFKAPEFDKYRGITCPKSHLTMYYRKMASHARDDKLLIHVFQDSLIGAALNWYMHLERTRIHCWKNLADAFLKQYKYNIDMAPDRLELQTMMKKDHETFKEYAQRWRETAAQVEPPLSKKEMVSLFIDTLKSPYYDKMIGSISANFSDIVIIGERVESGMRSGKIAYATGATNIKRPLSGPGKKKEGKANAVTFHPSGKVDPRPAHTPYKSYHPNTQNPSSTFPVQPPQTNQAHHTYPNQARPQNYQDRKSVHFDPIPITYTELCEYHAGVVGHSIENCKALKFKVQDLIHAGWISFEEKNPNIGSNPLPGHQGPSINLINEGREQFLRRKVEEVKTPLKSIFREMCKFGLLERSSERGNGCEFHPNAAHTLEECIDFTHTLQDLMDKQLIQIGCSKIDQEVLAVDELTSNSPKPLVIHYTKKGIALVSTLPKPITLRVPMPFPYKDNKMVPWKYDVKTYTNNHEESQYSHAVDVTNIAGVGGMTRSGQIYTPEELRNEQLIEKGNNCEKESTKATDSKGEQKKMVSHEEACEFLKLIKQSEYMVVDQLNRIPGRISLLSLMMNLEPHRKALLKVLNEAHVVHNISVDKLEGIVGNITANNYLTFNDDEIPVGGAGHNKALHIFVRCMDHILARVLIDNGSSLNVMPKMTLAKLPSDGSYMKPSTMVVKAFDGSRREVIGEITLLVMIGPIIFEKLKFIIDDKLVIVSAEEDLLVTKPSSTPYIDVTEEALETSFQALEITNTTYVGEGTSVMKPQPSNTAMMIARVMLEEGYWPGCGLGKNEQGLIELPKPIDNKDRFGLGYRPTRADKRRIIAERREKRMAKLENREPETGRIPFCDLLQSFQSAGFEFADPVAAAEEDTHGDEHVNLVRACSPNTKIHNWEIIEFPVILDSKVK
ncbi:uncharacterized protein LOC113855605 [Abrus precatorius]|uniref:Uncharacterized protein LOC113855605 n=1 Tax=Abrus precatorius TaxID=3816 RepID=A0A8B8KGU2_ABRPR|nr:uncharacterized protein LOC113855605 [Abrus precatorius]